MKEKYKKRRYNKWRAEDELNNSISIIDEIEVQKLSSLEMLINENKNLNYKQDSRRRGKNQTKIKEIKEKLPKKY